MARQNHLAHEQSPYLLQHKDNPVDWYPWGDEAFHKAIAEDKPIFLSIGYSTCHWCHVMEHESFEDDSVAVLMNRGFVSIKVDREERPDIDNVYMGVCQIMGAHCGWPLNVLMTPQKKPFYVSTYLPRESRYGRIGMLDLLPRVEAAWHEKRSDLENSAERVTDALGQMTPNEGETTDLGKDAISKALTQLTGRFDKENGGFGAAPKFPSAHNLLFLLRQWKRSGDPHVLTMVTRTLDHMRMGGIYDHVGFGFHRYSTDATWKLPHFEKMLYDQAMLAMAYAEAYQATRDPDYAQTVREILTYVHRDMTDDQGGFYTAEDADSEGKEGKFYLWSIEELERALGPERAKEIIALFNLKPAGNFEDEATRQSTGENILYQSDSIAEVAGKLGKTKSKLAAQWEEDRQRLFALREQRVHPGKDDKVLTDWNGLMIAAFARASVVLDDPTIAESAERAADFILSTMLRKNGTLWHRWRGGVAGIQSNLDDYVFMIWGLIDLYEATFQTKYLDAATSLNKKLIAEFWDTEAGGFFFTPNDGERLITRQKEYYDGAIPSGNSMAVLNLLRLSRLTGNADLEEKAAKIGRAGSATVNRMPSAFTGLLIGIDFGIGPSHEVVIAGDPNHADTRAMLNALRREYLPKMVVIQRPDLPVSEITRLAPYTATQRTVSGKATAYVCQNFVCDRPTTDVEKMLSNLGVDPVPQ